MKYQVLASLLGTLTSALPMMPIYPYHDPGMGYAPPGHQYVPMMVYTHPQVVPVVPYYPGPSYSVAPTHHVYPPIMQYEQPAPPLRHPLPPRYPNQRPRPYQRPPYNNRRRYGDPIVPPAIPEEKPLETETTETEQPVTVESPEVQNETTTPSYDEEYPPLKLSYVPKPYVTDADTAFDFPSEQSSTVSSATPKEPEQKITQKPVASSSSSSEPLQFLKWDPWTSKMILPEVDPVVQPYEVRNDAVAKERGEFGLKSSSSDDGYVNSNGAEHLKSLFPDSQGSSLSFLNPSQFEEQDDQKDGSGVSNESSDQNIMINDDLFQNGFSSQQNNVEQEQPIHDSNDADIVESDESGESGVVNGSPIKKSDSSEELEELMTLLLGPDYNKK